MKGRKCVKSQNGAKNFFFAKMAVSQPPEGLFGFCKGPNPSEFNGPIHGQTISVPGT